MKDDMKKDTLFLLSRKYHTLENKQNYKQFKNRNLNEQRKAERNCYTEQFELNKQDLNKSWKIIKNIIGKEDNKPVAFNQKLLHYYIFNLIINLFMFPKLSNFKQNQ